MPNALKCDVLRQLNISKYSFSLKWRREKQWNNFNLWFRTHANIQREKLNRVHVSMIHSVFCLPIEIYNVYSETRSNNNQSADEVTTKKNSVHSLDCLTLKRSFCFWFDCADYAHHLMSVNRLNVNVWSAFHSHYTHTATHECSTSSRHKVSFDWKISIHIHRWWDETQLFKLIFAEHRIQFTQSFNSQDQRAAICGFLEFVTRILAVCYIGWN